MPGLETDWDVLKQEFITNTEYPAVRTWLRSKKKWTEDKITNGNTLDRTTGWSQERAIYQQQLSQARYEEAAQIQKERVHKLQSAKNKLIANLIRDVKKWEIWEAKDKKLIYDILKTELGEPSSIAKSQAPGEDSAVEETVRELRDVIRRSREAKQQRGVHSENPGAGTDGVDSTKA